MEITQEQHQGISQNTGRSPKLTINHLPDELLVEMFDFYYDRRDDERWSIKLEWFKLIHVCKRWRSVMLASSSRLNLCIVLVPELPEERAPMGGHMKTVMSHHFPPLPIDINYVYAHECYPPTAKDMGRLRAALKRPHRIRRITLTGSTTNFDKLFKATKWSKCPLPALESLELRDDCDALKIPATFLKGSNLKLRTLILCHVSLPSISRLLLSASALTFLSLIIDANDGPLSEMSLLLSHLQGLPCLLCLELQINISTMANFIDKLAGSELTEPIEKF